MGLPAPQIPMDGAVAGPWGRPPGWGLAPPYLCAPLTCCRILETMGELCWSKTLESISSPASTLSTSLGRAGRAGSAHLSVHLSTHRSAHHPPVQPFAGGDKGLVEVGEAAGPPLDCLQVQAVAALQVLVGDAAQTVGAGVRGSLMRS